MANKPRLSLQRAEQSDLDAALAPFIERFVRKEKRERARSLFMPLKKRARARDLLDLVVEDAVLQLDSEAAIARSATIDPRLEGVFLATPGTVYRTDFGYVLKLAERSASDEEMFIASDGSCGLYTFDVGSGCLIAPTR